MPIPTIAPYTMPAESELPVSTAPWRPDPGRAVLLIHDLQRYFVRFLPADEPPTTSLLTNIGRLRQAADALGIPVVYTAQPGRMSRQERGLLHDLWGRGMRGEPDDRYVVPELSPRPADLVVTKYRYSAFHRTELAEWLTSALRDQLIVCGLYAHVGCLLTACDAFAHDIEPFVVADAVADFSRQEHLMALDYTARRCGVTMTTDSLLSHLRPAATRPVRPATKRSSSRRRLEGGS